MSRIGKQPIEIPGGVEIAVDDGNVVTVKGPRGTLTQAMHENMTIVVDGGLARVERPDDQGFQPRATLQAHALPAGQHGRGA